MPGLVTIIHVAATVGGGFAGLLFGRFLTVKCNLRDYDIGPAFRF